MDTKYQGSPVPVTAHQLARAKISDGKSVTVTVPQNTTINAGEWVLLDGFFGLAMQSAQTGANETKKIVLNIEQAEYETDQITTGDTFAKGTVIYFNATTKKFTEAADDGEEPPAPHRKVGIVTSGKDANNVIWFLLGPQA
jgi:predicted RecA/RadA family phage recombinase